MIKLEIIKDEIGIENIIGLHEYPIYFAAASDDVCWDFSWRDLHEKMYEKLVNRLEETDEFVLESLKQKAMVYIIEEIISKRGFFGYEEWENVKKEMLQIKSSEEEDLIAEVTSEVISESKSDIFKSKEEYVENSVNYNVYLEYEKIKQLLLLEIKRLADIEDNNDIKDRIYYLNEEIEYIDDEKKGYVADAVELYDIERKKQENVVSDLLYKRLIEKQLIRYFFPMFRGMSVEELSQDIYFAVLSTEAWFETSAGFKDEFDDMINGNGLFRGKSKRKMFD